MAAPSSRPRGNDVVRLLCRMTGAPDLRSYLGVPADAPLRDALVALEAKRRQQERLLSDPARAREAELFLEGYGHLREALETPLAGSGEPPDWYTVLGVAPDASYAAIERAWRSSGTADREGETLVARAWEVLGDPARRASYDRTRAERTTADNRPDDDLIGLDAESGGARLTVPGPELREVELDDSPAVVVVPVIVRGQGRWRGTVQSDHPAITTEPASMLAVGPGRHTIALTVDPRRVRQRTLTATVTLSNGHERHVVALRIRRADPPRQLEWIALGIGAAALVALGWLLGARTNLSPDASGPASIGEVTQIPTAQPCLAPAYAPLPSHIDVHVDGLGRPTGVSFGGAASQASEACVRDVVLKLEFPPTRDGRPAFHRYLVRALPQSPPPSSRGVP